MTYVYHNRNQWEHLVELYEEINRLQNFESSEFLLKYVESLTEVGSIQKARKYFDQVKAEEPKLVEQYPFIQAKLLLQEGKLNEVELLVESVLKSDPENVDALLLKRENLTLSTRIDRSSPDIDSIDRIKTG